MTLEWTFKITSSNLFLLERCFLKWIILQLSEKKEPGCTGGHVFLNHVTRAGDPGALLWPWEGPPLC